MSAESAGHGQPPKRRATEAAVPASAAVVRPVPAATLLELAGRIGADSELVDAGRLVAKRRDNVLGLLLRALSREEVAVMEDRGCRADDWSQVQVAEDFDPFRVRRSHFKGRCVLGRFSGEAEVVHGIKLASGIYDCTLINCQVGNDCLLEQVKASAANVTTSSRGAVQIFDRVGSVTCSGATSRSGRWAVGLSSDRRPANASWRCGRRRSSTRPRWWCANAGTSPASAPSPRPSNATCRPSAAR